MEHKALRDGLSLSRLGMGNMRLPVTEDGSIDRGKAEAIIDEGYRSGINYFDTAYIYHGGTSEGVVGDALRKYPRDSYYVADKFNFQAQPDYVKQFAEQLERLGLDRIDFYLLHGIQDNFIDSILATDCIDYFNGLKAEGKIRYFGFSFHGNPDNLKKMLAANDWDFVQIQLNYYDWEYGNQRTLYEILSERGIPVMVMEPAHGGLLAKMNEPSEALLKAADPDASLASWAMRWVMSLDGVTVVLSGMTTMEQMQDNVKTFNEHRYVTDEEKELLKKAAALVHDELALPCTGCRYCVPNCPMGLDIPKLLKYYNARKAGGDWRLRNLLGLPEGERPTACIGCGSCTAHCPQSIAVPDAMSEMSEVLEKLKAAL